jgi:hypothetical protein
MTEISISDVGVFRDEDRHHGYPALRGVFSEQVYGVDEEIGHPLSPEQAGPEALGALGLQLIP